MSTNPRDPSSARIGPEQTAPSPARIGTIQPAVGPSPKPASMPSVPHVTRRFWTSAAVPLARRDSSSGESGNSGLATRRSVLVFRRTASPGAHDKPALPPVLLVHGLGEAA